jgi:hypothetical protein
MLRVEPVTDRRRLRQFVELPYELYAVDPHWVPPLRRDEFRRLSAGNAFLEHAEIQPWLAIDGGRVVGRIAAIDDRRHNDTHRETVTWFGFFEARDRDTAQALLGAVETHARAQSSVAVRGPVNPSLNESAGLLVQGFDEDPYVLMPYNPPAYPAFVEDAGYVKCKDLLAWDIDLTRGLAGRVERIAERVRRRHAVRVRAVDMRAFESDLAVLQGLYARAWRDNWGFVAPTDAEMRQLAGELRPILDPDLVLFAEMEGRPVACAVAIPDVNQVLKRMRGRIWPFGIWHFLRRRSIVDRGRLLLLGVEPDLQRVGLYPLLIAESHRRGLARGYRRGELSWTLEDNEAVNAGIEAAGGRHYKTYRLYEKRIDAGADPREWP